MTPVQQASKPVKGCCCSNSTVGAVEALGACNGTWVRSVCRGVEELNGKGFRVDVLRAYTLDPQQVCVWVRRMIRFKVSEQHVPHIQSIPGLQVYPDPPARPAQNMKVRCTPKRTMVMTRSRIRTDCA